MNREIILAKYGELALKGLNRSRFEEVLLKNLRRHLQKFGECRLTKSQSTVYIEPLSDDMDLDEVLDDLGRVFGIATLCRACGCEKDIDALSKTAVSYLRETLEGVVSFKVETKRADKTFPLKSPEISAELGGAIAKAFPHLRVDVHNPAFVVRAEIRDDAAFVHGADRKGAGGLPVGTSGKALLLLSGGIDSPVAGYRMARRGVQIAAIHYASPPYTSDRALEKVEALCRELTPYCGNIAFFCVPFTKIQEAIQKNCPAMYFTVIMRRLMMEIAQEIAKKERCLALVTGESLGQVASQTLQAMVCTDAACEMPVLRPLVGLDKTEIIETARKIGTFDTSCLPYEDCCTVFTPRHPKVRPSLQSVEKAQGKYDFSALLEEAVAGTTLKIIAGK